MGLRELKEKAHQQYVRGKFAECAQTYQHILRLAPRDPNLHVRHAEACRRAGERLQAIASYRAAADLLLELGCESRARGALKAALELDPRDPILQAEVARLEPQAAFHDGELFGGDSEQELPLLPPLDSGVEPLPPPPPPDSSLERRTRVGNVRTATLPPIHRALPSAPSIPPLAPPVLLPTPSGPAKAPPRSATTGLPGARPALPALPPRSATEGLQAPVPPPPPAEALLEGPQGERSPPAAPAPAQAPRPRVEVRRLSPNVLAFRCSPTDSWALIRSRAPLEVHLVEDLEKLPPVDGDFTLDITVDPLAEKTSSAMH